MPIEDEGSSGPKKTNSSIRTALAFLALGLTVAYVVQIVRGRILAANRLGTNDIILVSVGTLVCVLLLNPGIFQRISRLEMPGLKVELDAVKEKQDRLARDLDSIRLVMPLLLPEKERAHLRNLVEGNVGDYKGSEVLRTELRHLSSMELIRRRPRRNISGIKDGATIDLMDFVELTQSGREWLEHLAKMAAGAG